MLNKKIIISFLTFCLLSSSIYAKQSDDERESKNETISIVIIIKIKIIVIKK